MSNTSKNIMSKNTEMYTQYRDSLDNLKKLQGLIIQKLESCPSDYLTSADLDLDAKYNLANLDRKSTRLNSSH